MQCLIRGKNIEVTQAISDKIVQSLSKIEKYSLVTDDDIAHVEIRTYKEKMTKVTVTIDIRGKTRFLKAVAHNSDLYSAIEAVPRKLEEQLRKIKDKNNRKHQKKFTKTIAQPNLIIDED